MIQTVSAKEIQAAGGLDGWIAKNKDKALVRFSEIPCAPKEKHGHPKGQPKGQARMSEHEEQAQLIRHCKEHEAQYPELALIHAVPNGGARHPAVAAKLKAEGVKAGVPDLFLPVSRGNSLGLYIELKASGGKVSEEQWIMLGALARQGYTCIVAYGWEKAWAEIESYLKSGTVLIQICSGRE
ncbi:MAG: VRR-NUC domain-containing protein [Citrobacter braakii]